MSNQVLELLLYKAFDLCIFTRHFDKLPVKRILLILFALVSLQTTAQKFDDYTNAKVFFKDSTTAIGFAYINPITSKLLFKKTRKEKRVKYTSKEVHKVILMKDTIVREFRYKKANDRRAPRLLQLVIDNEGASLYINLIKVNMLGLIGAIVNWEEEDFRYYLVKKRSFNATFIGEKNATSKKGMMKFVNKYLHDCPELVEKAKNKEFKLKDTRTIIDMYNSCSKQIK